MRFSREANAWTTHPDGSVQLLAIEASGEWFRSPSPCVPLSLR
ncbi:hypothetical protein [Baaleninema simplex]|nr:hypothetical protein [Baaleninema simplex]